MCFCVCVCVCVYFCVLAFCAVCVVACSIFVQYFLALHPPHMVHFHKLLIVWHHIFYHYVSVKVSKCITAAVCLLRCGCVVVLFRFLSLRTKVSEQRETDVSFLFLSLPFRHYTLFFNIKPEQNNSF